MSNKLMGNTALPGYVKITATAILAVTYIAALCVAVYAYVAQGTQAQLPSIVTFILGTGLSMALGAVGMHQGASLLESPSPAQQSVQPSPAPTDGASAPSDSGGA